MSDHFQFGSVFIKKITKPNLKKKNLKPVQTERSRFFQFGSVFFRFD